MDKAKAKAQPPTSSLDPIQLQAALDNVHRAGMPGLFAEVRDRDQVWRGASGVADVASRRPVTADMRHRVGSITKSFTAAAVLQQVENGQLEIDAPVDRYLPPQVIREHGKAVTVRMLLNHTSGLAEYLPYAYPSLRAFPVLTDTTPESDSLPLQVPPRARPRPVEQHGFSR